MYQGIELDFAKSPQRVTMAESLARFGGIAEGSVDNVDHLRDVLKNKQVTVEDHWGLGKLQMEAFEALVEGRLEQPTSPNTRPKSRRWPVAMIETQTSPTVLSCSLVASMPTAFRS